jgi:hypothetical protein
LQDPPKFTQILNFGLKMCHLAFLFARSSNRNRTFDGFLSTKFLPQIEICSSRFKTDLRQGCQIFLGATHQNGENCTKHLPLQDPSKFTQNGIFGLKNIPSGNLDLRRSAFKE